MTTSTLSTLTIGGERQSGAAGSYPVHNPARPAEQIDPQAFYPRLHCEPYGVAALVIPFNWPLAVMMTKLTSALTAGNTAVVKLPPTVPLAALQFGAAFAAALPPGVVNVLALLASNSRRRSSPPRRARPG
jgi:acyl-CoA reductase-like NAD-dependent aldehyde dehydrogenase